MQPRREGLRPRGRRHYLGGPESAASQGLMSPRPSLNRFPLPSQTHPRHMPPQTPSWQRHFDALKAAEPLPPKLTEYDPQSASPFFDGRCPPEIRARIWAFALSETKCSHDGESGREQHPAIRYWTANSHYARPGYECWTEIPIGLLLTCRRIYLEAWTLPMSNKEHVFWFHRAPHGVPVGGIRDYFYRFREEYLKLAKEVHIYYQMYVLEDNFYRHSQDEGMKYVEKLKLTIRRGDWWFWENNHALYISPSLKFSNAHGRVQRLVDVEAMDQNPPGQGWGRECWGNGLRNLPALREFTMELETSDDKKEELERIVALATHWRFPMKDDMYLGFDTSTPVSTVTWRGPQCLWSNRCVSCNKASPQQPDDSCPQCVEKAALVAEGKGPMLIVKTLKWVLMRPGEATHPLC